MDMCDRIAVQAPTDSVDLDDPKYDETDLTEEDLLRMWSEGSSVK
jgi:hypothetical protein